MEKLLDEKRTMMAFVVVAAVLSAGCNFAGSASTGTPRSFVAGAGDVTLTHEQISAKTHRVTASAAGGLDETDGSVVLRLGIAADRFAAMTCPAAYEFSSGFYPNPPVSKRFTDLIKAFEFTCE